MKIYTRTGDAGQTSIVGGSRLSKDAPRIEAYGTVDELNAHLGLLAADASTPEPQRNVLFKAQNALFNLGAYLAGTPEVNISPDDVKLLEADIDAMDTLLPPLNSFILPGGCTLASRSHVARTVCRRAERRIVSCSASMTLSPIALTYINRLSDWLFTFSRLANLNAQVHETPWRP